jgi:hypothetical protein
MPSMELGLAVCSSAARGTSDSSVTVTPGTASVAAAARLAVFLLRFTSERMIDGRGGEAEGVGEGEGDGEEEVTAVASR